MQKVFGVVLGTGALVLVLGLIFPQMRYAQEILLGEVIGLGTYVFFESFFG